MGCKNLTCVVCIPIREALSIIKEEALSVKNNLKDDVSGKESDKVLDEKTDIEIYAAILATSQAKGALRKETWLENFSTAILLVRKKD